jgi:DsbC/DsbD-like thiol-disulfide interchange protein
MRALFTLCFSAAFSALALAQATPNLTFRGQPRPLHAAVTAGPSDLAVTPGSKVMLFIDVTPNPKIHVYAPGAKDYIPITVKLEPQANVKFGKLGYPKSEMMTFADEKVPVFQKPFRLMQEVTVLGATLKAGASVPIKGTVEYQACDDKVCYPPESAPIVWSLVVR